MFSRILLSLSAITSLVANENLIFSPETISSKLVNYSDREKAALDKDFIVVQSVCFDNAQSVQDRLPRYVATAGEPGARKTTILERFIHDHPDLDHSVYLDSHQRALRYMVHTYYNQSLNHRMITAAQSYDKLLKEAYLKWQDGSDYIVMNLFERAIQNHYDIVFGTDSTDPQTRKFLTRFKDLGYRIELLLCSCENNVLEDALDRRNQEMGFALPHSKEKLFALTMPVYFELADKLYFYWSDDLAHPERLAAVLDGKTFEIFDLEAYINFVNQYEIDRKIHLNQGASLPSFEELLSSRTSSNE